MAYIKLFFAADNSQVSPAGQYDNAVELTLRADLNEMDSVRLYAQADTGYSVADTKVQPVGTESSKWSLAPDNAGVEGTHGDWGALLNLGAVGPLEGDRVYFWARARALDTEDPVNDTTVTLDVEGIASAV